MQYNAGMGNFDYNQQEDYDNQRVQQIREELGEFDFDAETNHGSFPLDYRPLIELENHARYDGEWV